MKLKEAADRAGKPIYLEMSSVNPVVVMEGALRERGAAIADEFFASCTLGAGQFCTSRVLSWCPTLKTGGNSSDGTGKIRRGNTGRVAGKGGRDALTESVAVLEKSGAKVLCGGKAMPGPAIVLPIRCCTCRRRNF